MPDWFLKPHPQYGTTYRILYADPRSCNCSPSSLSRGDVLLLGEAYAFGVVWSFVFKALSMVVLRFKDRRPREYKVPLNIRIGNGRSAARPDPDLPGAADRGGDLNLLTKEVATVGGLVFTVVFFIIF